MNMINTAYRWYYEGLDSLDEKRAAQGDEAKPTSSFALDADLAFAQPVFTIGQFCRASQEAAASHSFFSQPITTFEEFRLTRSTLTFPTPLLTEHRFNNEVTAKITGSLKSKRSLIIFHQWNATGRQTLLSVILAVKGYLVIEVSMPYHLERSRPDAKHADYMLSASLGRTLNSFRQAVSEGRLIVRWLKMQGVAEISVLGISLGSWIAAIVAALEVDVKKGALFLAADSLADMVWSGRATRHIRAGLEPYITREELNEAWCPVNLNNFAEPLSRTDLSLMLVLADRDKVVLPRISSRFKSALTSRGANITEVDLNCGHYSLSRPPYAFLALRFLVNFLAPKSQVDFHR